MASMIDIQKIIVRFRLQAAIALGITLLLCGWRANTYYSNIVKKQDDYYNNIVSKLDTLSRRQELRDLKQDADLEREKSERMMADLIRK